MAAPLVQSSGTAVLGLGSTSAIWGGNTTSNNLVVVGISLTNAAVLGTVTSITDSQSNAYNKAVSGTLASLADVLNAELWYSANIVGGAGSVTVNHTIDACSMVAREYSGKYVFLDGTSANNGSSTSPNSGTVASILQANELVIIATGDDKGVSQTWTAAGAYGNMTGTATTLTGMSMQDTTANTGGAQTGTLTLGAAANWESLTASFRRLAGPLSMGPAALTPQGMAGAAKPNSL